MTSDSSPDPYRRRLFIALLVVFNVALLEGGAYWILDMLMRRQVNYVVPTGRFVVAGLSDAEIAWFFRDGFDPDLGWTNRPGIEDRQFVNRYGVEWSFSTDALGGRRVPGQPATRTPWMATFGDSFTFGYEVDDEDTLQAKLAVRLGRDVANYGVAGYGPGQALLRFEKELAAGLRPEVVILATFDENVLRVINRFRPFYAVGTPLRLGFKPRFQLDENGTLEVVPPALDTATEDRSKLAAAIDASAQDDYWAATRARLEPPYFFNLLRLTYYQSCHAYRASTLPKLWDQPCRGYYGPSWRADPTRELMDAIYGRFVDTARAHGARPILLFMAWNREPGYATYVDHLRTWIEPDALVIDGSRSPLDGGDFRDPKGQHFAPATWSAIAEHVAARLADAGWIAEIAEGALESEDHPGDRRGGERR